MDHVRGQRRRWVISPFLALEGKGAFYFPYRRDNVPPSTFRHQKSDLLYSA